MYRVPFSTAPAPSAQTELNNDPVAGRIVHSTRLRALLLFGSLLLATAPLALFEIASHWSDDPGLFQLLRGMTVIKAGLAALALTVVWWRLGRPTTPVFAATYIGGVWALALAAGLIWQLTLVIGASALFHAATIVLLLAAWRDSGPILAR